MTFAVLWNDFIAGDGMFPAQDSKSKETYFQDEKGRLFLHIEKQQLGKNGQLISDNNQAEFVELMINGVLGIRYEFFPKWDKHGQVTPKNETPVGYTNHRRKNRSRRTFKQTKNLLDLRHKV
jgi:hypothetical protein